jgi:hypothetical protein
MQCPFSIRHDVLPDVNSQLKGFDDDVDVFSQVICSELKKTMPLFEDRGPEIRTMDNKVTGED